MISIRIDTIVPNLDSNRLGSLCQSRLGKLYGALRNRLGTFGLAWALTFSAIPLCYAVPPRPVKVDREGELAAAAYEALQKDSELSALNLGVKARPGGVAVLWGPAPSKEAVRRAEQIIRKVPGVVAVVVECQIVPSEDPLVSQVIKDVQQSRSSNADKSVPAGENPSNGAPYVAPTEVVTAPPVKIEAPKSAPVPTTVVTSRQVSEKPTRLEPTPPSRGAILLPPEPLDDPKDGPNSDDPFEKVRRSEKRFQGLIIDARSGWITITGQAADPEDAWDLADKLSVLPDVKRVIMGKLTIRK